MLYERWREIARAHKQEVALRDLASGQQWTFEQLALATEEASDAAVVFPRGQRASFILELLRGWRAGAVVCPLDDSQTPPNIDPASVPSEVVHLKSTSATTGSARLVAFTGEQLAADALNIVRTMDLQAARPNVGVISLAHSYGFSNLVTPLLLQGIPLILGASPLPEHLRLILQLYPEVVLPAVPALWRSWNDANVISPSIRLAISAGAPLPLPLESEVLLRSGLKLHNFYGATECGGIAYDSSLTARTDSRHIGQPLYGVEVGVSSEGCLEVRSRAVGQCYWPDPAPELSQGRYRTADLAQVDSEGVYLTGRSSDLINVAGRKLAPELVEQALRLHPAVRECIVFGITSGDAERADEIVACITLAQDVPTALLRQFLLERLEAWQTPRLYWVVNDLPANERGKLSRAHWRARYLEGRGGVRDP